MARTMTIIPLLLCLAKSFNVALLVAANNEGVFYRILADNPTVRKTIQSSRSSLECAYQCLRTTGCTGFSFLSHCEFYSSTLNPVSNVFASQPKAVYSVSSPGSCYDHDQFEIMRLGGSDLCIRIFTDGAIDGLTARENCRKYGGYVAALDTVAKQDDFRSILESNSAFSQYGYWVGLYDLDTEGVFIWDKDGRNITASDDAWNNGQPNGETGNQDDQDCGYLDHNDNLPYIQDKNCLVTSALNVCEITI